MKNNKGITLTALVITIIVLLILAGVGVNFGIQGIESAKDSKLVSELNMVQHAILEQYTKYQATKDNSYLVGNVLPKETVEEVANELGITLVQIPSNYEKRDYYQMDKASLLEIGIQDSNDEYIINYRSGEVINLTQKKTKKGIPLYVKANSFYE